LHITEFLECHVKPRKVFLVVPQEAQEEQPTRKARRIHRAIAFILHPSATTAFPGRLQPGM
jgi:hypothetical protein